VLARLSSEHPGATRPCGYVRATRDERQRKGYDKPTPKFRRGSEISESVPWLAGRVVEEKTSSVFFASSRRSSLLAQLNLTDTRCKTINIRSLISAEQFHERCSLEV
jgi:hypothetical protein